MNRNDIKPIPSDRVSFTSLEKLSIRNSHKTVLRNSSLNAQKISKVLDLPFFDSDREIEKKYCTGQGFLMFSKIARY